MDCGICNREIEPSDGYAQVEIEVEAIDGVPSCSLTLCRWCAEWANRLGLSETPPDAERTDGEAEAD